MREEAPSQGLQSPGSLFPHWWAPWLGYPEGLAQWGQSSSMPTRGLSTWLGLPHCVEASGELNVVHGLRTPRAGVPANKEEASCPFWTWPQKSHGATLAVLHWSKPQRLKEGGTYRTS